MKSLALVPLLAAFCGCRATIDQVEYTTYSNRYKNSLWIRVNTREGLFEGRETFFNFKRCNYAFSMTTKSNQYTQADMQVRILPGDSEAGFTPDNAVVKITQKNSKTIIVGVSVDDDRIPKLINGSYKLKLVEATPDHAYYSTK